jgi:hypothetical protein
MQQLQQPVMPQTPRHHNPVGMPPAARRRYCDDPPTAPLVRRGPEPTTMRQGQLPAYSHHRPAPGIGWAPTALATRGPRGATPARRRLLPYVGVAITAVAAVVLIAGLWAPGFLITKKLDITAAQAGVAHILSDPAGYDAKNVSDVTCNDGQNPTIARGGTFLCQATIDRITQQFVVTFTDDAGGYQVGAVTNATRV